jgi:hypothetical protein
MNKGENNNPLLSKEELGRLSFILSLETLDPGILGSYVEK